MMCRIASLGVVALLAAAVLQAQTTSTAPSSPTAAQGHEQHQEPGAQPPADDDHAHGSSGSRQHMMGHGQMMGHMDSHGADLEALRARMNEVEGDERIDAIVVLLNALVRERAMMHERMMQMHSSMDHAHEPAR